jgi:hypothetical protein
MNTKEIIDNCTFAEQQFYTSQQGDFPRNVQFMGRKFVLDKNVFSPEVFCGSSVYVPHLPLKP